MKPISDLAKKIKQAILAHHMVEKEDTVLVGVSGGPDSVFLLHQLNRMRDELGIRLAVAHVNHMTRGDQSDADEELVADLSRQLMLPCYRARYDVPAMVKPGCSLQMPARAVRYRFFQKTAESIGARRVALGHQADDQAETVLLNILRGSGLEGLKGIPPRRGIFIRPLLGVRRNEILTFLVNHNLPYREDASNLKPTYTRNRIRLELIPLLEGAYNPRVVEALVRTADICRDEEEYLEGAAFKIYSRITSWPSAEEIKLDLAELRNAPAALRRRLVRLALRELTGTSRDLEFVHVASVLSLLEDGGTGGKIQIPGNVQAQRLYTHLCLKRQTAKTIRPCYSYPLAIPGLTPVPEIGGAVRASLLSTPVLYKNLPPGEVFLDYDSTGELLWVRRRLAGDLFWPLGMEGKMKLKKFFINRKVPEKMRDCVPIVVNRDDIVWVGGMMPGERYRVSETTRRVLHLKLERYP